MTTTSAPSAMLFPEIEPYASGQLEVGWPHSIYWETCGNPQGVPVVFVHGGPGAGCSAKDRRFFDPAHYRIILFDQRGCGRSRPIGELEHNSPADLVDDMERLRDTLGVASWHVFGGSWGSTLSLLYAQTHPQRCLTLTLRGIFLMRSCEVQWWLYGMRHFFPEHWQTFAEFVPAEERCDLLEAYWRRLTSHDARLRHAAARNWCLYEGACCNLLPNPEFLKCFDDPQVVFSLARLEAHFIRNHSFEPEDRLLRGVPAIRSIPAVIVQGRYDVVCPPRSAFDLHERWPESELIVVDDAGHTAYEPGTCQQLVAAMQRWKAV
jgi:proline iminopeptidase